MENKVWIAHYDQCWVTFANWDEISSEYPAGDVVELTKLDSVVAIVEHHHYDFSTPADAEEYYFQLNTRGE